MRLIDSHCHLYSEEFKDDIQNVVQRAESEGIKKIFLPAIDSSTLDAMLALESTYPALCHAMIGLHPCSVKENFHQELDLVHQQLQKRKFAAIGETGLDFYWDRTFDDQQLEAFRKQIDWAIEYNLPLIIHSRDSIETTIQVIREKIHPQLHGIFHCFSGNQEQANEIVELGFFLGIGGVLTFKNSTLSTALERVGLENLVLETDAPYLAPVPFRGKRNEPSYIVRVAEKLAQIKGTTIEEVAKITTTNAVRLFGNHNLPD